MTLTQITNLGPPISAQEIETFEQRFGCTLPEGYKKFLLATNGGSTGDIGYFLVRESGRRPNVWAHARFFYGLRRSDFACSTLGELIEIHDELFADGMLPFATDDFGNEICLCLKGEVGTVHFWSHDLDVPTEKLAESFEEFFIKLRDHAPT